METVSSHDFNEYNLPINVFYTRVEEENYKHTRSYNWATDIEFSALEHLMDLAFSSRLNGKNDTQFIAFEYEQGLVAISLGGGSVTVQTAAMTAEEADTFMEAMREIIPVSTPEEPDVVSINFWALGVPGPQNVRRRITVPSWEEISGNYTGKIKDSLEEIMKLKDGERFASGQLLLWQGLPGTGKTYALRALARDWRKWCNFHYITDPERFFGGHSDYMLSVLLGNREETYLPEDEKEEQSKWNLLILEDSGELLAADAKEKVGQGLSRLLNVVDGLIGQGLKIIVLVTTNEELKSLHPAVTRHGRCASQLEFGKFTKEEAEAWLKEKNVEADAGNHTLAELFALEAGKESSDKKVMGFA